MELKDIAKNVMTACLAVKPEEDVLIITDDTRLSIGQALYEGAKELGCEAMLMVMGEREVSGQEPPRTVAEAMKAADVVICPTAKSLTHTNAKIAAQKTGTRIATMPGITEEMFRQGAMTADYAAVEVLTDKVCDLLTKASTATIIKDGCTLTLDLTGREGIRSPGVYREKGQCGNLPSGEGYIAPLETGVNGEMIVDGSMVGIGKLDSPLKFVIKNGKIQSITGDKSELLDILLAFPGLLLAITVVAVLGSGMQNTVIAISIFSIPSIARMIRGEVLSLKGNEYIAACKVMGEKSATILFRHIIPNAVSQIIVNVTLMMGTAILTASSLSFLGLGVQAPNPEWGSMLSQAREVLRSYPLQAIVPGVAITLVVMSFSLMGDGLRDALDPRLKNV